MQFHLNHVRDPLSIIDIQCQIGKGSYGEVFKGILRSTGEDIAMKIIPLDNAKGGNGLESIRKEIEILKECHNPHIVQYMGSFIKDSSLWVCWLGYC